MFNYYELKIIPIILNRFKVSNIVLSGILDENTMNQVSEYCENNNCTFNDISFDNDSGFTTLSNLSGFNAIFLNNDPNWYTVFNELKIVKKCNDEFPLVFICNNIFPHKRRDSYSNPDIIPKEFRKEYSKNFEYDGILICDGLFHALEENTSKNGVSTAIEDFLNKSPSIGLMNIKLLNGITILYPKNTISQIRIGKLFEEIKDYEVYYDDISDSIIEKELLLNQVSKFNSYEDNLDKIEDIKEELSQKDLIIEDYENKIKIHNEELSYKNSQINNYDSKLSLQDTKIKNFESKLVNSENEISNLNVKLNSANNQIDSLKTNIFQIEEHELELNKQLQSANDEIKKNIEQLNNNENALFQKENQLNSIKRQYIHQLSKLDTKEYCISCYKDEISNNHLEIEYLKKDTITRKIFSPLAYIYLIFKSNPKDLSLNFKLYKALKNSECFDIGYYLNKNKDLRNSKWGKYFSLELHYVCNGFNEEREFNKKYFNRNSKKELLNYIINCH